MMTFVDRLDTPAFGLDGAALAPPSIKTRSASTRWLRTAQCLDGLAITVSVCQYLYDDTSARTKPYHWSSKPSIIPIKHLPWCIVV